MGEDPGAAFQAWEAVKSLVRDEPGGQDDASVAARLIQLLKEVDSDNPAAAIRAAAEILAGSGRAPRLALVWAASAEPLAVRLALTLATLLPAPLDSGLVAALRPLLGRKRAPAELQIAAAAALLRSTGKEGPAAREVIAALLSRSGKARSVDRLNRLEEQAGPSALIAARRAQLEKQIRMRCPRCRLQLRRPQMAEHLWSEHSLLLDGRRVRQPWRLLEEWIAACCQQQNPELLARCRALAQQLDPEHGLRRVDRLLLAGGIADAEARRGLLAEAGDRGASLCPHCFAFVPVPQENMPRPLNQSHGRLSLGAYCVEVSESGLVPRLTIEAAGTQIFQGREPGRLWLTGKGATLFLAGPTVTAALAYAVLRTFREAFPIWPVTALLLLALAVHLATELYWWLQGRPLDRAIDFAWTRLVPHLCARQVTDEASTFLAGLALTTPSHGRPRVRQQQLEQLIELIQRAVAAGTAPLAHLAALQRLAVADAVSAGHDPVPLVVDQVGPCFAGRLPLAFAQWLLAEWEGSWWTSANLARLRVLLCDRAFEAGWEIADLRAAGFIAPAVAEVLQTADAHSLAPLRLLWSLRPSRPWTLWSEAITVFELAEDPEAGCAWLHQYPDLLLLDQASPPVIVCGRGIVFHETLFTKPPGALDIRTRRDFDGMEYELAIAEHRFQLVSDPAPVVARLEQWFRYHFGEFLPQLADVCTWKAPAGSKAVASQEVVACPDCRCLLLPCVGQVGRALGNDQGAMAQERPASNGL